MRDAGLVSKLCINLASGSEEVPINAAGKAVHGTVLRAFAFVQALPPGEYQVRPRKEVCFGRPQPRRRSAESRQLIHAVVNNGAGCNVTSEIQGQRSVIPQD